MNNPPDDRAGLPRPRQAPDPSLDVLALADTLAEIHTTGGAPPLGELISALPAATDVLADALIGYSAEVAEAEAKAEADPAAVAGTATIHLSPGTLRALESIVGIGEAETAEETYRAGGERDEALTMVAEAPAAYNAASDTADEVVGLLALAHRQHLNAEMLAALVMLSPEFIRWLDRVAQPPEHQPDVLVFHLMGALEVERSLVVGALAQGEPAVETSNLIGTLTATEMLTPAQRGYWAALLATRI